MSDLDKIFNPCSLAVIGASGNRMKFGSRFLNAFLKMGFKGKLYAVNPVAESCLNCSGYRKITDIPGPLDHVIVCIPAKYLPMIIEQCVQKGVNSVAIYASGFSESGTSKGLQLEKQLATIARKSHLRIIGPNCLGIYCPSTGLSFRDDLPQKAGTVAILSQSGGIAITSILSATERNIYFSKAISYGNESDLQATELLAYLAQDNQTSIIMFYLEGTKNGHKLFHTLKMASAKKPVIILKGGISEAGNRAVISHTGALAGTPATWSAAIDQSGAIQVFSLEELVDTTLALMTVKPPRGRNLGLISISGGSAVNLADLSIRMGFSMPPFQEHIKKELSKLLNDPGTGIQNPVDMAAAFFYTDNFKNVFQLLDQDDGLDIIIMHVSVEPLIRFKEIIPNKDTLILQAISDALLTLHKPFALILPYTLLDDQRKIFQKQLLDKQIPVFPTIERALQAIKHSLKYHKTRIKK